MLTEARPLVEINQQAIRLLYKALATEGPLGSGSSVLFHLVSCGQDNQSFRLRQPTSENAG
jgi:hypothetical protein